MTRWRPLGATLLLLLPFESLWAGSQEIKTLESAIAVVTKLCSHVHEGMPRGLLRRAAGVAIVPDVRKAGLVIDVRAGRGVVLVRALDGAWTNPVFVSLKGGGIGGQAGIETTDLVLVFMTRKGLDSALHGKLAVGGDVTVAIGPVGEEAVAAADARLKADIYSYSHSRGLFAGLSVDGAQLRVKTKANEAFYGLQHGGVAEVLAFHGTPRPAAEALKSKLAILTTPPVPSIPVAPCAQTPAGPRCVCEVPVILLCMDPLPALRGLSHGVAGWVDHNVKTQLPGRTAEWGGEHGFSVHGAAHRERD